MKAILLTTLIIIAGIASAQDQYRQNYQYQPPAEEPSRVPIPEPQEPMTWQDYVQQNPYAPPPPLPDSGSASALTKCWAYTPACKSPFK